MRKRGEAQISSPIGTAKCAVESTTTTASIAASTTTVTFRIFASHLSNTISSVPISGKYISKSFPSTPLPADVPFSLSMEQVADFGADELRCLYASIADVGPLLL